MVSQGGHTYEPHPHDRQPEGDILYYEVTDEELEAGFKMAEEAYIRHGVDLSEHPFWKRIKEDPSYKEEVLMDMRNKLKHSMHTHQELNHETNHD